jgi:hypothetical protein
MFTKKDVLRYIIIMLGMMIAGTIAGKVQGYYLVKQFQQQKQK